jgi:hypothetical protein
MESDESGPVAAKDPSAEFMRIAGLSLPLLEAMMVAGDTPSPEGLEGYEYCGYNIAPTTALLGIRKFVKAFFEMADGACYGCNTPAVQNGLQGPWIAQPNEAAPRRYAFFSVTPVDPQARDNDYLHALLLDYGRGGNQWYDPSSRLRDYLVRCAPGREDLLLGKAYFALGPMRVTASYFVLERRRPMPDAVTFPVP